MPDALEDRLDPVVRPLRAERDEDRSEVLRRGLRERRVGRLGAPPGEPVQIEGGDPLGAPGVEPDGPRIRLALEAEPDLREVVDDAAGRDEQDPLVPQRRERRAHPREQRRLRVGQGDLHDRHVGRGPGEPERDPHPVIEPARRVEHRVEPRRAEQRDGAGGDVRGARRGPLQLVERAREPAEVAEEPVARRGRDADLAPRRPVRGDDHDRARAPDGRGERRERRGEPVLLEREGRRAVGHEQDRGARHRCAPRPPGPASAARSRAWASSAPGTAR